MVRVASRWPTCRLGRILHSPIAAAAEGLVQVPKQLPDAPSAGWCRGVAAEHVDDDGCRTAASLLDVTSTDGSMVARDQFGRSRRVRRRP
jgi:hypothetical protein